jgi:hypothetical protein
MPDSAAIDINELARLIAAELDSGMQFVNASLPWSSGFHISSMRVRLGQMLEELPPAPSEETPPSTVKKFLLNQRYPLSEQGWEFEVELAAGAPVAKLKIPGKPLIKLPAQLHASAAGLFEHLPVAAIKGVNSVWTEIFNQVDIHSIGDLIAIKHETLDELVRSSKKKYPLNVQTKARLLNYSVPKIPASPADQLTLYFLLTEPPLALRKLIGTERFSISASEELSELLALLYTLLDSRILKKFTLLDLRTISIENQNKANSGIRK